jgi:anti-sigma-K factor RskA
VEEVKAYIESGILELYVLGEVSHAEKVEVEAMALKHPAIKAELDEIEKSMELYAGEHEIEPAPELRARILNSVLTNLADDNTFNKHTTTTPAAKVVPMPVSNTVNFYKYAFAACLALLLVSVVTLYTVYNKLQQSNNQVLALSAQTQQFSKTVSFQNEQLTIFRDTAYKLINLPGTGKTPQASMKIAWSPAKKKVIIDMAGLNLPANDKAHQYQLWAIVAGKPVDLGVFDAAKNDTAAMKVMKPVNAPQAFAVTLEPRGGSINPTMANMMVIAKI